VTDSVASGVELEVARVAPGMQAMLETVALDRVAGGGEERTYKMGKLRIEN
jgi:hypothetical protein